VAGDPDAAVSDHILGAEQRAGTPAHTLQQPRKNGISI
jgi:hypothetical protein